MSAAERSACAPSHAAALAPRHFVFPRDDGAHDAYALEIWRTFGRVSDGTGKRYDIAVNVSRSRLDVGGAALVATRSRWFAQHLITISYSLLDEQTLAIRRETFVVRQSALGATIARDELSIVAQAFAYAQTRQPRGRAMNYALSVRDATHADGFSLEQTRSRGMLPLGPGGVMQTGSCASNEAYAYAFTRNETSGVLRFDGIDHRVSGSTWFEHEFAQRELGALDAGWNRFEVQFDDGRDVDARFARDADGNVVATSGAFVAADGTVTYLTRGSAFTTIPPDARKPDADWHSYASDVTYPAMWYFGVRPGRLGLATVEMTHDQEFREPGRTPYYWGAIVVEKFGPPGGDPGHGFVELTGYAARRAL